MAGTSPAMTWPAMAANDISVAGTGESWTCCKPKARRRPSRSSSTISSTGSRKALARAAGAIWPMRSASPLRRSSSYVAAFNYLPSQVVRGVHVGFLLLLTFGLIGNFTARSDFGRALGWLIGARRLSVRALSMDLLCRPDRARRRSDAGRSRGRHAAGGADLRGHAAADGARAAADVRRLPALLVLRPVSAGAAQSPRL